MDPLEWLVLTGTAVAVTVEGFFIIAILRALGHLDQQMLAGSEAQCSGSSASSGVLNDASLEDIHGDSVSLARLWQRGKLVLCFISSDCSACQELLHHIATLQDDAARLGIQFCLLSLGEPDDARQLASVAGLTSAVTVVPVHDARLFEHDYGITGTPALITADFMGRVDQVIVGPIDRDRLEGIVFAGMTTAFAA